jgi:hypothetical protein
MRKPSGRARVLSLASLSAVVAYASWIRPRILRFGATSAEAARTYPGDEIVPHPNGGATMATTLPAPPAEVWPWLVQMGGGRGGWYSWDQLDNGGEPSADHIAPDLQRLEVGQHLYRPPKGPTNWWTVIILEPNHSLVLQTSYDLLGRSLDPDALPRAYTEGTWGFYLSDDGDGRTRLVVRTRSSTRPRQLTRPLTLLVGEPVHLFMQARQFRTLRVRVTPSLQ